MIEQYQLKIEEIFNLLQKRTAVYPVRDEIFVQLCEAIDGFTEDLLNTIDFETFQPENEILSETERFAEYPIFICGSMKSGTTLLCQLLDNHPDLLVMPWDSHYVKRINTWKRDQFSDIAKHWVHTVINPTGKEPFWFLGKEKVTFEKLLQYLYYFLTQSQKDIFVCGVLALYAANRSHLRSQDIKYWVEKTPHNELKARMLHEKFPNAVFLHILRNPLPNIASLMKLSQARNWEKTPEKYAHMIKKLFRAAQENQKVIGENKYYILKYEDLVSQPEETLTKLSEFLNIPFDDTLLVPTENGRPGIANSMYPELRIQGQIMDHSNNKRYEKEFSEKELQDIVTVLYSEAIHAGYNWNQTDLRRCKRPFLQQYSLLWAKKLRQFLARLRNNL